MFIAHPFGSSLRRARSHVTHLRQDLELARKHGDVLVLVSLALLQFLPIIGEFVEQMVNNVGLEDLDVERIRELLRVPLDSHVERKNRGVSADKLIQRRLINYSLLLSALLGNWR